MNFLFNGYRAVFVSFLIGFALKSNAQQILGPDVICDQQLNNQTYSVNCPACTEYEFRMYKKGLNGASDILLDEELGGQQGQNYIFTFEEPGQYALCIRMEPMDIAPCLPIDVLAIPSANSVNVVVNSECETELQFKPGYEPSYATWGFGNGDYPYPINDSGWVEVWAEGHDGTKCSANYYYDPVYRPDPGQVVKLNDGICSASFAIKDVDEQLCKVTNVLWRFGDGELQNINNQLFTNDQNNFLVPSEVNHIYNLPSEHYGDGNGYDVTADVQFGCNYDVNLNPNCWSTWGAVPIVNQEILGPDVELTPFAFNHGSCTSLFGYSVLFKHPVTEAILDYVQIVGQTWEFVDAPAETFSNQRYFVYEYPVEETRQVKLTISYLCEPCGIIDEPKSISVTFETGDILEEATLTENTFLYTSVLNNAASEFKSAWPLAANDKDIQDMHPYAKASAGVWRTSSQNAYNTGDVPRLFASQINMKNEGSYEFNSFAWNSLISEENPNWLKANEITQYNSSSNEIENKDVQEVYSAAVYTPDQKLPLAVGQNMKQNEIAYAGFEEELENGYAGNFFFSDDLADKPFKVTTYDIKAGLNNVAVVDATEAEMAAIGTERVVEVITSDHATKVKIYCVGTEVENGLTEVFVDFDELISSDLFRGVMVVYDEADGLGTLDYANVGHTGTKSLEVSGQKSYKQHFLKLTQNNKYFLTAWVAVNPANSYYNEPVLQTNLGIDILFEDESNNTLFSESFEPTGPIIEGWQQIEGVIDVSAEFDHFVIRFDSGDATTAFFDDLRLFPLAGNMQSYVYDEKLRVTATLDENNFATYYSYDAEGKVYQVRKETARGIRTIQESSNSTIDPIVAD